MIFWNIPVEFVDLGDEVEAVIDEAFERGGVPGLPRVLSGEWRRPVEAGPFEELREAEVEREIVNTRDEWIANLLSVSSIAHQPEADRAAFAGRLRELVPPARRCAPDPHRSPLDAPCLSWPSASAGSPRSTTTCGQSTTPRRCGRAEQVLGLRAESYAVDLAAGSGKLTRRARRPLRRGGGRRAERLDARGTGGALGRDQGARRDRRADAVPDDSADAVFVGDAFHWFDGPAAVAELERVLRPQGGVALLWNHWWSDGDDRMVNTLDPPLPAEAQALFDEVYFSSGRAPARAEMAAPLEAFAGGSFTPLVEEAFSRSTLLSGAKVVDLYATVSAVASLPPAERNELKRKVLALIEPSYRLEITTVLEWTRRA